jgi:hypothetical protein
MDQETRTLIKSRLDLLKIAHREVGEEVLSKTAFWLLCVMASLVDAVGKSALSVSLISADELGITKKALKHAWKELLENEYMEVRQVKKGNGRWSRYVFNLSRMEISFFDGAPTITFHYRPDPLR